MSVKPIGRTSFNARKSATWQPAGCKALLPLAPLACSFAKGMCEPSLSLVTVVSPLSLYTEKRQQPEPHRLRSNEREEYAEAQFPRSVHRSHRGTTRGSHLPSRTAAPRKRQLMIQSPITPLDTSHVSKRGEGGTYTCLVSRWGPLLLRLMWKRRDHVTRAHTDIECIERAQEAIYVNGCQNAPILSQEYSDCQDPLVHVHLTY